MVVSFHGEVVSLSLTAQLQQLLLQFALDAAQLGLGLPALGGALLLDAGHLVQRLDELLVGVLRVSMSTMLRSVLRRLRPSPS